MNLGELRKYIIIICLFISSLSLMGCGMSDKKILKDVKNQFLLDYSSLEFEDVDLEMDKRQTNSDEKTDISSVFLVAENDEVIVQCSYNIRYIKYNDGWELEECDCSEFQYTVKKTTITEEDANHVIADNYQNIYDSIELQDRNTNLLAGEDTFVYHGVCSDGYLKQVDQITVTYKYSLSDGWCFSEQKNEEYSQEWSILGKWSYHLEDSNMWIKIHKITQDNVEFEYDFDYLCLRDTWTGLKKEKTHYFSEKVEKRSVKRTENGIRFRLLEDEMATPYIYVSKHGGLTFDGFWYNPDDTYVFFYDDGDGYETRKKSEVWPQTYKIDDMSFVDFTQETTVSGGTKSSSKTYNLYGQYKTLEAEINLSEHVSAGALGEISIIGDGKVLYSAKAKKYNSNYNKEKISVDVEGVKSLTILRNVAYVKYKIDTAFMLTNEEPTIMIKNIQVSR